MIDTWYILDRCLLGVLIGSIMVLLRHSIDRRKGLVVEFAAVILPVALASIGLLMLGRAQDVISFGYQLSLMIQLLFLILPVFVLVRIAERVASREPIHISDLFRITTVISLALFVISTFPRHLGMGNALVICLAFFLGEAATGSDAPARNRAYAFSVGFLAAITSAIVTGNSILEIFGSPKVSWSLRSITGSWALVGMIASIVLSPQLIKHAVFQTRWFQRVAWSLSAWRLGIANPTEQMAFRSPFELWSLSPKFAHLNHGSFGAVPRVVAAQRVRLLDACAAQPMEFFARHFESDWFDARFQLATWLGTHEDNLAFCENSTAAMNEIAGWFPLDEDCEVLINDHEYGAVHRTWQRRCARSGAKLSVVELPVPFTDEQQIVDAILGACQERTKLVIMSHITSATAIRMPVETLCAELKARDIATCIDGPHAILQEPLKLSRLGCDFYTASCHKWLCAPNGSGFVYVDPKWHSLVEPLRVSWGRLHPNAPEHWSHELLWSGTRDPTAYLSIPTAINFFQQFEYQRLDERNHALARYARERLAAVPGLATVTPDGREWYGWMVALMLPEEDHNSLQQRLLQNHGIDIPIFQWKDRYLVRISCHLYNTTHDVDLLCRALKQEMQT